MMDLMIKCSGDSVGLKSSLGLSLVSSKFLPRVLSCSCEPEGNLMGLGEEREKEGKEGMLYVVLIRKRGK